MINAITVEKYFTDRWGEPAVCISAAGRANIIGEHTDYHEGFVMPFAIDSSIFFCAAQAASGQGEIHALNTGDSYKRNQEPEQGSWQLYVHILMDHLQSRFQLTPELNIAFGGDLPMGAGVSSSSALCCGLIEVMDAVFRLKLSALEKVFWASEIEHGTGVKGGKMDQYAICHGKEGHAMLLDCRTLQHKAIELPDTWQFLLINTGVKHNLAFTAYNQRRQEAEQALSVLQQNYQGLSTLRDAEIAQVQQCFTSDSLFYKRAHHVVSENQRVLSFELSAKLGDIRSAGRLLNQSHASLRDQYEVSCAELDFLQEKAAKCASVYGSRMMGGGFGGCIIALVQEVNREEIEKLRIDFQKKFGNMPDVLTVHPAQGLRRLRG